MGAGLLPTALHRGTLYVLLGQERAGHHSALWSDFGGTPEKGEKPYKTAIREGCEELNGFLGVMDELEETVNKNMILSICFEKYTTFIFRTRYSKELPYYFANIHKFAEHHLKDKVESENGLFEKKQIQWFSINKLKDPKFKDQLRPYYVELANSIIKNEKFIIKEIEKLNHSKHNKS